MHKWLVLPLLALACSQIDAQTVIPDEVVLLPADQDERGWTGVRPLFA